MPLLVSSAYPEAQLCKPLAALQMCSLTFYLTNGNDRISHLTDPTTYQNYEELSSLTCIFFLLVWDQTPADPKSMVITQSVHLPISHLSKMRLPTN